MELGHDLVPVDLERQAPAGKRDRTDGREDGHRPVICQLPEDAPTVGGTVRQLLERLERTVMGRPAGRPVAERREVARLAGIAPEEERLVAAGRCLPREEPE